jgi:hypothetical protein
MTIALLIALIAVVIGCTLHLAKKAEAVQAALDDPLFDIYKVLREQRELLKAAAERDEKRDEMRSALFTGEGRTALRQRLRERQETAAKG